MKLTKAHKAAGIIEISTLRNFNGSFTCVVVIESIDRQSNGTNFRKWTQAHTDELTANYLKEAVRNPVLRWHPKTKKIGSIDGRHTCAMLSDAKEKTCTADIHFDITDAQAGQIFYQLTMNSKRMAPWDAYAAAIQGEYDFAMDIDAALTRFGFTTPNDDGFNSRSADFNGFTPLKDCHDIGGIKFLHAFLTVLSAWKGKHVLEDDARKNVFQRGLIDFLQEALEHYSPRDLAVMLAKRSSAEIKERAIELAQCERVERGNFKTAFFRVLELSNFRRAA